MTDARLLATPELLLMWSRSLEEHGLKFEEWVYSSADASRALFDHQTGGSNVDPYESCADDAGHSVRVAKVAGKVAGGR